MPDLPETKRCPFCDETIKRAARKCPHCQSRQSGLPTWGILTLISVVSALVIFGGGFILLMGKPWPLNPKKFSKHRADLNVIDVEMKRARKTPEKWVKDLGTNYYSDRKWTTYEVEIRFLDQDGQLIDRQLPQSGVPVYIEPSLWLTGYITNSGKYAWNVYKLEARFHDQKSNLVYVEEIYERLFVPPESQTAFRLELSKSAGMNTNLAVKVRIQQAEDANSREN